MDKAVIFSSWHKSLSERSWKVLQVSESDSASQKEKKFTSHSSPNIPSRAYAVIPFGRRKYKDAERCLQENLRIQLLTALTVLFRAAKSGPFLGPNWKPHHEFCAHKGPTQTSELCIQGLRQPTALPRINSMKGLPTRGSHRDTDTGAVALGTGEPPFALLNRKGSTRRDHRSVSQNNILELPLSSLSE